MNVDNAAQVTPVNAPDAAQVQGSLAITRSGRRPSKRPRVGTDKRIRELRKCYLAEVPLEVLAEILSHTPSPRDLLALARSSKHFCATLVNNSATVYIWRAARARCVPLSIPDPLPTFTEPAYAAFLFDGGLCEVCKTKTWEMYASFSLRFRVCDKISCRSKWRDCTISLDPASVPTRYLEILHWIPRVEENRRVYLVPLTLDTIQARQTDWLNAVDEYNRESLNDTLAAYVRRKQALTDRLPLILDHARSLMRWKDLHDLRAKQVKSMNEAKASSIAFAEGWTAWELMQTGSYGLLHRSRTMSLEVVTNQDFEFIRVAVERDICTNKECRERRTTEQAYQKRRADVKQHYDRLKFSGMNKVLPTLGEFRKLSVIKILQDKTSDATQGVAQELKNSKLVQELLKDNLQTWREAAREALAAMLGFPHWKSFSKKRLHPVERTTAWFRCKKCADFNKAPRTTRTPPASLNFPAVCEHSCPHLNKKQRATEVWRADRFEPDQNVIDAVTQVLQKSTVDPEESDSWLKVDSLGIRIVCDSCPSGVTMDFKTMVHHCKRHDNPQFSLLAEPSSSGIEHGLAKELLNNSSHDAVRQDTLKIYGCRHCQQVCITADAAGTRGDKSHRLANKSKVYTFNGIRSHVKVKHEISDLTDEDFFREKEPKAQASKAKPGDTTAESL